MRHLRLVRTEPDAPRPHDVVVHNRNPRYANVTYADIVDSSFTVNGYYPHGLLGLTHESGAVITHECIEGDHIEGAGIHVDPCE